MEVKSQLFWFVPTSVCATACKSCDVNLEGKCDPGNCWPGYIYDTASMTCKGNASETMIN